MKCCSMMKRMGIVIFGVLLMGACSTQGDVSDSEEMYQSSYSESINYIDKYAQERQDALQAKINGNNSSQATKPESTPTPKPTER